jgi:hypothetical protein
LRKPGGKRTAHFALYDKVGASLYAEQAAALLLEAG